MEKIFGFIKRNSKAIITAMMISILSILSCVSFSAEGTDLSSSFSSALSTIQSDILNFIGLALPVGLAVFGSIIAIKKGISFVRGLLGK